MGELEVDENAPDDDFLMRQNLKKIERAALPCHDNHRALMSCFLLA
jgi:hypothetical protein